MEHNGEVKFGAKIYIVLVLSICINSRQKHKHLAPMSPYVINDSYFSQQMQNQSTHFNMISLVEYLHCADEF